jgi:cytochrome c55X
MALAGPGSRVEPRVQTRVRARRFAAKMPGMSTRGLLLRVVLMLSLLLNGLNVAMAAPMALALLPAASVAEAEPPCHGDAPRVALHAGHASSTDSTPHDGDHGRIKDCLRDCAQQPGLTPQIAWQPSRLPRGDGPQPAPAHASPMPVRERISRPPIA